MLLQKHPSSSQKLPLEPGSLQQALRELGAVNAILRSTNVSSIATDENGLIQFFNLGAQHQLGYSAADVLDTLTLSDITDPKAVRSCARSLHLGTTMASFEALILKASRGIQDRSELTFVHRDGHRVLATVSVTVLVDDRGHVIGYSLIGTESAADKLERRALLEEHLQALITIDPDGFITDLNQQMEKLIGCTRQEVIGGPFKNWFTEPERAEAGIRRALSDRSIAEYELIARARDGQEERAVRLRATPFYDRRRQLDGVCASLSRPVTSTPPA